MTVEAAVQVALLKKLHEPLNVLDSAELNYATDLDVTPRYFKLAYYLQTQQWEEADQETYLAMKAVGDILQKGYLNFDDIRNFPCSDLRVIDQLWVRYSDGRFGFSVQKDVYLICGGKTDCQYYGEAYAKYAEKVGWKKEDSWYRDMKWDDSCPTGHLPASLAVVQADVDVGGDGADLLSRIQACEL